MLVLYQWPAGKKISWTYWDWKACKNVEENRKIWFASQWVLHRLNLLDWLQEGKEKHLEQWEKYNLNLKSQCPSMKNHLEMILLINCSLTHNNYWTNCICPQPTMFVEQLLNFFLIAQRLILWNGNYLIKDGSNLHKQRAYYIPFHGIFWLRGLSTNFAEAEPFHSLTCRNQRARWKKKGKRQYVMVWTRPWEKVL